MEKKKLETLKKFIDRLPQVERERAVLAIGGEIFNWNEILERLKRDDALSKKIENILEEKIK